MYAKLAIQLQQKLGYRKASKWNRRDTTRLSLLDYMALGLMYVEHIFYIEPDLLFHAQTAS